MVRPEARLLVKESAVIELYAREYARVECERGLLWSLRSGEVAPNVSFHPFFST